MPGKRPNVILISDDQHHPRAMGYMGHPHALTPNLDRLATEGTHFTRAYCTSPICTPSRMSYLTGKYIHEIGVWNNNFPLDRRLQTFARELDESGIPSTMLGKLDLCGEYQDGGFTDMRILRRRGVSKAMSAEPPYRLSEPFWHRIPGAWRDWRPVSRAIAHAGPRTERVVGDGTHRDQSDDCLGNWDHDRKIADWALEFLQERGATPSDDPWLLYVGFVYPHEPYTVPAKHFDMYWPDNVSLPVDARFPNPDLHPALAHYQQTHRAGQPSDEALRRVQATYLGMVSCVDDLVGEIMAELDRQGLADDTIVIFTSDHGDTVGEHGLYFKKSPYEGSVGVPLIMRGPGVPAGQRIDDVVSLIDLYPTLLDITGMAPQEDLVGSSWMGLVQGNESRSDAAAFSEYHGHFFPNDWMMIVEEEFKYVWFANDRPLLFNLKEDPDELVDLSQDAAHQGILRRLDARLRQVCDPDSVSMDAKHGMGLIGPDGEDYTQTKVAGRLPGMLVDK